MWVSGLESGWAQASVWDSAWEWAPAWVWAPASAWAAVLEAELDSGLEWLSPACSLQRYCLRKKLEPVLYKKRRQKTPRERIDAKCPLQKIWLGRSRPAHANSRRKHFDYREHLN